MPTQRSLATREWIAGLALVCALLPAASTAQNIKRGSAAPEIDLPTLTGGQFKLSALKGHAVVVTFWGTWCPPCRDEFPEFVAANKKYRDAGLMIVAVNQRDQELSTKDVQDFVTEFGVDFPVALDARGRTRRTFRLIGLPTTVFIDAAGNVQAVNPGPMSHAVLTAGLAAILPSR